MLDNKPTRRPVAIVLLGLASAVVLWFFARTPVAPRVQEAAASRLERAGTRADSDRGARDLVGVSEGHGGGQERGDRVDVEERRALETGPSSGVSPPGALESRARLRIVDRASGGPIPGAEVTRVWAGGARLRRGWASAPANEDGELEVAWNGSGQIDLHVEASGFVDGTVAALGPSDLAASVQDGVEPAELDPVEIGLERGASLTVVPVGFAAGVEGVVLLYEDGDARSRRTDQRSDWDGDGPVVFEGVAPGRVSVALCVRGEPVVAKQSIATAPGEDVRVELRARRGEELRGRIVEKTTRQPLAGVTVRAKPELSGVSTEVARLPFKPALSGADGSFVIAGLPPGKVLLSLWPGFGPSVDREIVVIEGEATRTRELALPGAGTVAGRVHFPEGAPDGPLVVAVVATSEVSKLRVVDGALGGLQDLRSRGAIAEVSADRSFRCETVPTGRSVTIVASAVGALGVAAVGSPLAFGEVRRGVDVTLQPFEPLSFRVADPSGDPVRAVKASFRWSLGRGAVSSGWEDLESPDGSYQAAIDASSIRLINLTAEGYLPLRSGWPIVDGRPAPQPEFVLTPSLEIHASVRDTSGLAVSAARVFATPAEVERSGDAKASRARRKGARADRFGRATLGLDAEGAWSVQVTASGYEPSASVETVVSSADSGERLEFVLERSVPPEPATVEGSLVRQGDGAPLPTLRFDGLRGGSAEVDGARFRLVGLRPGRVTIVAHADGYESLRLPVEQVRPGETLDLGELSTRGATRVEVRVRDDKGRTIRDARVRLMRLPKNKGGRADLPPRVDFPRQADGRGLYARTGVARVRWRLVVDHARNKRHVATVLVSGSRKTFEVVLEPR